jgi:hypothetical protein
MDTPSLRYSPLPVYLRKMPIGRIYMVHKRGWGNLVGFGRKYPAQRAALKTCHPGVVVKSPLPSGGVVEMVPGTSKKPDPGCSCYVPQTPVHYQNSGEASQRQSYYLLGHWRTVRRSPQAIRDHFADLSEADIVGIQLAMDKTHGKHWAETSPLYGSKP